MRNPCKYCKERHAYCHCEGQCKPYTEFLEVCKVIREKKAEEFQAKRKSKKIRPTETLSCIKLKG
jgi:hypothetical protein